MLTPASTDPNRKEELKRREENPLDFGMPIHRPVVPITSIADFKSHPAIMKGK